MGDKKSLSMATEMPRGEKPQQQPSHSTTHTRRNEPSSHVHKKTSRGKPIDKNDIFMTQPMATWNSAYLYFCIFVH